jgi:NADPH:quinone reductase-like Zn-dependent oxidoreductase
MVEFLGAVRRYGIPAGVDVRASNPIGGTRIQRPRGREREKGKRGRGTMKAIVQDSYGSTDVLQFRDIEKPVAGDDDLLIRVHAAGVDMGVWHLMTGLPYLVRIMGFGFRKPKTRVRGREVAGTVEAAGKNVTEFKPGDPVFGICEGSFAEYVCAKPTLFAPKPANLSFQQAAVLPVSGSSALRGLRDVGKLKAGQKVMIIGAAGGVGTHAVQLAKAFGASVTGVCSTSKAELVRSIGADAVIDYTREEVTDGTRHFDLILDTAGRRPLSQLRRALTAHGTIVMVGGEGGDRWLGGFQRQMLAPLHSPFSTQTFRGLMFKECRQDLLTLNDFIEAGKLTPIIDRTYPLSEAASAIRYLEQGHSRGKVVLSVG